MDRESRLGCRTGVSFQAHLGHTRVCGRKVGRAYERNEQVKGLDTVMAGGNINSVEI